MKKIVLILFILFSGIEVLACSCETPKKALEFYSSDYVFEALAIEKSIKLDSSNYDVRFRIIEQYKGLKKLKYITFNFSYQKEGERDSCYWEIDENEKWLIYSRRRNGELTFSSMCSNSRTLKKPLDKEYQFFLKNGNNFDPLKYTFSSLDDSFKLSKPKKDIDSIISDLIKNKKYATKRVDVIIDIDENGNLIAANLWPKKFSERLGEKIIDTIYGLNKTPNIKYRDPENQAEKDLLNIIRNLKKWDKVYIPNTETSVNIRQYLQFYIKQDTIKLYY